jgi:signal transduction histidine kinase/CheY-like chemotaxis protein
MANWEKLFASTLRVRVLVPTILVMAALLAITMFIINGVFRSQFESSARERLTEAGDGFRMTEIDAQQKLEQRFSSLTRQPAYHAVFQKFAREPDARSLRDQLERMYANEDLAQDGVTALYFTPAGKNPATYFEAMVLRGGRFGRPGDLSEQCAEATMQALAGAAGYDTVRVDEDIYSIISIPVFYGAGSKNGEVIGALTFGKNLNEESAKLSFQRAGMGERGRIAFIAGDHVSRVSLDDPNETDAGLRARFHRLSAAEGAALEDVVLNHKHFYCTSGNFITLKKDAALGYLLFYKYQEQLDDLARTQNQLILVSLLAMLGGTLLIMFFVWRALWPLQELRRGAEAVGRGDFTHRVVVRGNDECGQLAKVFNRMTADVEQTQSQLKQTVDTLQSTQAQLIQSEKLSAVGEFVAGVAHELNNPLATVMGFSEILKTAPVEPKYQRHLQMIFKSAERCQKIVQSLLTFARRHQPERLPVAVNKLVEEVLEIVAYQLRTNNIEVVRDFDLQLPPVLADGHQVQQVLINLVNNARQAIESHQPSGKLIITTEADAEHVRIRIADNGPGISPENLRKIFDPFFTTKGVGKGTGLGLSLCYGLIKEHGGNISVTSKPGAGATFVVELPVAVNVPAEFLPAEPHESHQTTFNTKIGAGKTVLVIDDEEMLLSLADAELSANGYSVITANTGEAGLRELASHKVDAVICDLKMPGLNGRQVLERVRAQNPALAGHFAFVTGDVINDSLAGYFESEKVQWLNKPFSLAELRGIVKTISQETSGQ